MQSAIKNLRNWVPVLGILALAGLFLKLPEIPNYFGLFACKTCSASDPYLPMVGAGYFAALVAVSLLFPAFPGRQVARGGLLWSVLLAAALTYMNLPKWCGVCLFIHACHIAMWTIWVAVPAAAASRTANVRERCFLALFAPIGVVALFSCINLTFMAYAQPNAAPGLKPGDTIPVLSFQTNSGRIVAAADAAQSAGIVINFVSPDCSFSKAQLPVVNDVAAQLPPGLYRFINISPRLSPEFVSRFSTAEWVEDKDGKLRALFKVLGYPTLFVVGNDGKIRQIIAGAPKELKGYLTTSLSKPK